MQVALAAFPFTLERAAYAAGEELSPWVNQSYRTPSRRVELQGRGVLVPYRIHYAGLHDHAEADAVSDMAACLLTRSTDGHLRQRALQRVLGLQELWAVPYVVLLTGEYVAEINSDVVGGLPKLDRTEYVQFVIENRALMRSLRARAVGYWNRHHRVSYPERRDYPALAALREIESWAADHLRQGRPES